MNSHAIIPLIAASAYLPLLALLYANRPWQRQHKLLLLYLTGAALWSFGDFFFRSDLFMNDKILLGKIILCILFWAGTQFHYFMKYIYSPSISSSTTPYAYLIMAASFGIIIAFLPESVSVVNNVTPTYGLWLIPPAVGLRVMRPVPAEREEPRVRVFPEARVMAPFEVEIPESPSREEATVRASESVYEKAFPAPVTEAARFPTLFERVRFTAPAERRARLVTLTLPISQLIFLLLGYIVGTFFVVVGTSYYYGFRNKTQIAISLASMYLVVYIVLYKLLEAPADFGLLLDPILQSFNLL